MESDTRSDLRSRYRTARRTKIAAEFHLNLDGVARVSLSSRALESKSEAIRPIEPSIRLQL
ncbi:MAG TPA: hypothetical protein VL134_06880 [Leptolyngbya sp.]|nr:hypothetical protein [Leptolyngbya sp.]